jgi:hypothetical protein
LAGRDEQLDKMLEGLREGPQGPRFCQALLGDRGVGKTVLLNELERRVRADLRWPVLSHQAIPGGDLVASIADKLPQAVGGGWRRAGRMMRELEKQVSVGANLGVVRADVTLTPPRRSDSMPGDRLEMLLRMVGSFAAEHASGLLLTIDEAHVIDRVPDLAALGAAMQMVVRRARLPVAVVLAGLPELRSRFHGVGTFLERMEISDVDYLSKDATRFALVQPAAELGVTFAGEALEQLVGESGGYPYLVQVLGYETWEAAAGADRIEVAHTRAGIAASRRRMGELFQARWDRLSDLEQQYLIAVAHHDGPVAVGEVAKALRRSTQQLSSTRAALIEEHRLLSSPRYGQVRLALSGFGRWILVQERTAARRRAAGQRRTGRPSRP